jgi:hypothetical protein
MIASNDNDMFSRQDKENKREDVPPMAELVRMLDMNSQADMLLATREDILKCKIRDGDISDHTINHVYAQAAKNYGIQPKNAFQLLMYEMNRV